MNHQCGRKPSLERRDEPESNEGTVSKSSKRQFNDQPAPWKAEAKATHPHAASEEPAIKHRANQQPQKDKVQRVFTYAVWAHFVTFSVVVAVMNAINRRRTAPPQPETVIPLQNEPNYVNTGASADEANIVIDRDSAGHVRVTHRGNHSHRSKQEGNTGGTGVSV